MKSSKPPAHESWPNAVCQKKNCCAVKMNRLRNVSRLIYFFSPTFKTPKRPWVEIFHFCCAPRRRLTLQLRILTETCNSTLPVIEAFVYRKIQIKMQKLLFVISEIYCLIDLKFFGNLCELFLQWNKISLFLTV